MKKSVIQYILIFFLFFLINFIFYQKVYWNELIFDHSTVGAVYGEIQATEWGMENIYRSLISGINPFKPIKTILYPFGVDVVGADAGFAFNFLFFRPFFSAHQSLSIIVVTNLLLANIGMFLLLRKMRFSLLISTLIALAYGNMTFLTVRLGHPGYSVIYLFPWFYFFCFQFIESKNNFQKLVLSFFIPFTFILTLWQNMYYFILLLISCFLFGFYFLFYKRKFLLNFIQKNILFLFAGLIFSIILILPWLISLYETMLFSETVRSLGGWSGAIEFSSDLFGFFIPSIYNYYYADLIINITNKIPFARGIFENFTYPGIIIIICYFSLIYLWTRKRITKKLKNEMVPYLIISIVFLILTLGPFLHILGNWYIQLEDNVKLVLPMPFVLLHYIPFLGNIRAPGRLIVGFIFFASIVCAYVLKMLFKDKSLTYKVLFSIIFVLIFIFDHRSKDNIIPLPYKSPNKIFEYIAKDNQDVSVLEIPFTIRDGFTYFGDFNSIGMTIGQSIHKKNIIGGYSGRIPDYVKSFYSNDPFIGYIGRAIDENIRKNPSLNLNDINQWKELSINTSLDSIDFLTIKYVVLNTKYKYKDKIESDLLTLGYKKTLIEEKYVLFAKQLNDREFLNINFLDGIGENQLGMGWHFKEQHFRWVNRKSSVLFKVTNPRKMFLEFEVASFYKAQKLYIYLNQEIVSELNITTESKKYKIPITRLKKGINFINFIFYNFYKPSDVLPNNHDLRKIAAQFTFVRLIKQ